VNGAQRARDFVQQTQREFRRTSAATERGFERTARQKFRSEEKGAFLGANIERRRDARVFDFLPRFERTGERARQTRMTIGRVFERFQRERALRMSFFEAPARSRTR
jgi:hypothetical protein